MRVLLPFLVLSLSALPALAQAPVVRAVRLDTPVRVDGVLDESVWRGEHAVTGFLQRDPDQGSAPRQRTEVRLAYDADALYVGARMHDTAPDSIVARLARRDNDAASDMFALQLDPLLDKRTGYFFAVSAAGTLMDGVLLNDGWDDDSWDGVWQARVRRDEQGWTAEMRIPFSQLRYRAGEGAVWGVNLQRSVVRYNESDALVYTPRGQSGFVSRFAELHGLDLHPAQHVALTPYVTNRIEDLAFDPGTLTPYDPADPFHGRVRNTPTVGGDLRASLGSRLTLNATVNPDFGQVEIDPAVVNLSDVESFFSEKRPFFTEGVGVFRTGNNGANDYPGFNWPEPMFFYSRRIGRAPRGDTPPADFEDRPLATRILGAAKVTGQLAPGWNVGTVQAFTRRESARLETAGTRSSVGVEPAAWYGVWRTTREWNDRRQGLGFMGTSTVRAFEGDTDPLRDEVNSSAWVGTVDGWSFLDSRRVWVLSGWASGSDVRGNTTRMTALQRSFPHYRQRPDRPDLGVDPNATVLRGWGSRLWLNKQEGRLLFNAALGAISPDYDTQDLGFQSGGDVVNAHVMSGWQWNEPNSWRQYANVVGAVATGWDMGGNSTLRSVYLGSDLEQRNRWSWGASLYHQGTALSPRATRGGPILRTPARNIGRFYFDTNGQKPWFWSIAMNPQWSADGSWTQTVSPSARWRPRPNLGLQAGPEFVRARITTQFWDNSGTLATGSRFATLDQTQWSMNLRVDYAATPQLSVQVFVQPLFATLAYGDLKELARARTDEFLPVTTGPLFANTFASLRGNAVVRWEYAPGSAAYLVWTQERANADPESVFDAGHASDLLASARTNHVFMVKVAHHFDL